jgi:hypothetical protein
VLTIQSEHRAMSEGSRALKPTTYRESEVSPADISSHLMRTFASGVYLYTSELARKRKRGTRLKLPCVANARTSE